MNKLLLLVLVALVVCVAQAQMMGGKTKQDPEECEDAARYALVVLNGRSNSIRPITLSSIEDCVTQVVRGIRYEMILALDSGNNNISKQRVTIWQQPASGQNGPQFEFVNAVKADEQEVENDN